MEAGEDKLRPYFPNPSPTKFIYAKEKFLHISEIKSPFLAFK